MERNKHGLPVVLQNGNKFVPADVIALLSGVNFGSVEKVLLAIKALHEYSGTDMEELLDPCRVPTHRVILGDSDFAHRETETLMCALGVTRAADPAIATALSLPQRFRGA